MDNIIRPDKNMGISSPHNIKESKERLDGLVNTLHRLVSRLTSTVDPEEDDGEDEGVRATTSDTKSETVIETVVCDRDCSLNNVSGTGDDPAENKSKDDELMALLDDYDPTVLDSQTSEYYGPGHRPTKEWNSEDITGTLSDNYTGFGLSENCTLHDKQHEKVTSKDNISVELSNGFASFDLSELLNEAPEQCFNFDSLETENPGLELDFQSILNESSAKANTMTSKCLPVESSKSKQQKYSEDFFPLEYNEQIGEPFENYGHVSPMETDDPLLELDLDELMNEVDGKAPDQNQSQLTDNGPQNQTLSPKVETPTRKYVSCLNDLFSKKPSELSDEMKTKRRLILSGEYKSKYSEKMAIFLGLPYEEEKKESAEIPEFEAKSNGNQDTVNDSRSDETGKPRRQCTLKKKTCYEGYEKKPPRQDPKVLIHNQMLMASYHASQIDYPTEIRNFVDTHQQEPCTVVSTNTICVDLTEENLPGPSTCLNTGQIFSESMVSEKKTSVEKDLNDIKIREGKKSLSTKYRENEDTEAPLEKSVLSSILEEKFQATTFTQRTAKLMKKAEKMEGVMLPCTSRILNTYGANKYALQRSPGFINAKLSSELRRAEHEKLMDKIQMDRIKYGDNPDIFVNEEKEMILSVSLYHPVEKEYLSASQKRSRGQPKLAMNLEALSSNTLEELCNNFLCSNDYIGCTELQHPKDYSATKLMSKDAAFEKLPTATMLIHDTVYSFQDGQKGADTGAIISEWEKSNISKNIGPLKYADLATTQLIDLTLQFGYPYVFIHLDSCEHVVVFSQARKMNSSDDLYAQSYPMIKNTIDFPSFYCKTHKRDPKLKDNKKYKMSKAQYLARYAIVDSDRLPDNPTLMCRTCVEEFCFDKKGKKVGKFKLFPFMQVPSAVKDKP